MIRDTARFRRWLAVAMTQAGFENLSDLARRLDVEQVTLNRWVNGKRALSPENAARMAQALGVAVDDLYRAAGWLGENVTVREMESWSERLSLLPPGERETVLLLIEALAAKHATPAPEGDGLTDAPE